MVTVSQKWDKRVGQWHDHVTSAAAFGKVLDGILALSQPQPSDVCVDLGAGSGFVTTALAPRVASVHAVDISPAMTEALAGRTAVSGPSNRPRRSSGSRRCAMRGWPRCATSRSWPKPASSAASARYRARTAGERRICGMRPERRPVLRRDAGGRRRGARRVGGPGQDGEEVPGPSGEILVGGTILARYLGGEYAAGPARGI